MWDCLQHLSVARALLEIPVYYEKFVAYISPGESLYNRKRSKAAACRPSVSVLQEGHCLGNQVMNICDQRSGYSSIYEAGSIDTLVKIVDENGGTPSSPELHLAMLTEAAESPCAQDRRPRAGP